jgi:hypothetical protein
VRWSTKHGEITHVLTGDQYYSKRHAVAIISVQKTCEKRKDMLKSDEECAKYASCATLRLAPFIVHVELFDTATGGYWAVNDAPGCFMSIIDFSDARHSLKRHLQTRAVKAQPFRLLVTAHR